MAAGRVREVRPLVEQYEIDGRRLNLLASGRVVNLAAAEGHPASVMDLSFAVHALVVEDLVTRAEPARPGRARRSGGDRPGGRAAEAGVAGRRDRRVASGPGGVPARVVAGGALRGEGSVSARVSLCARQPGCEQSHRMGVTSGERTAGRAGRDRTMQALRERGQTSAPRSLTCSYCDGQVTPDRDGRRPAPHPRRTVTTRRRPLPAGAQHQPHPRRAATPQRPARRTCRAREVTANRSPPATSVAGCVEETVNVTRPPRRGARPEAASRMKKGFTATGADPDGGAGRPPPGVGGRQRDPAGTCPGSAPSRAHRARGRSVRPPHEAAAGDRAAAVVDRAAL